MGLLLDGWGVGSLAVGGEVEMGRDKEYALSDFFLRGGGIGGLTSCNFGGGELCGSGLGGLTSCDFGRVELRGGTIGALPSSSDFGCIELPLSSWSGEGEREIDLRGVGMGLTSVVVSMGESS